MSECKNHQNDSRENYLSSKTFILDISKNYQALTVTIFERAIASSSR
ncbi:hypothetical protein [Okeania sp. KiyG1]|nr:hypothetical protein [Okeania sp. KiyG1]